jgi:NarL family two-component system response regulator LiaR
MSSSGVPVGRGGMKRIVLVYGLIGGILVTVLQWTEYRFLVIENSYAVYGGLVALVFAALGIWLGTRVRRPDPGIDSGPADQALENPTAPLSPTAPLAQETSPAHVSSPFLLNENRRGSLGITRREMEVLELMAQGLSNQEIAAKLFVSENTVKTHLSRVFDKLGARRRTQAVQLGKEMGLLP